MTILGLLAVTACGLGDDPTRPTVPGPTKTSRAAPAVQLPKDNPAMADLIPRPTSVKTAPQQNFAIVRDTQIRVADERAAPAAELLGGILRPATGFRLPVVTDGDGPAITLDLRDDAELGEQGYRLEVTRAGVSLTAASPAGLFSGVQTLRQLLPADVENRQPVDRPWVLPGGTVTDLPRFAYRGTMLDVARHFFDAETVKRFVDRAAQYKINYVHLHLSDDQGWRIQIDSWPKLTTVGGANEVGGGPGGFYTKKQFREIVRFAAARGVTIVPEIDMPGHVNAALHAYPELNCDGQAPPAYTDTQVGFSSLCIEKDITYDFVRDVLAELAELTPGPYLHIGGDEAQETSDADFRTFFGKVLPVVGDLGKTPIGWHEFAKVPPPADAVVQYWRIEQENAPTAKAAARGNKVLMSPAQKTYLDMKYAVSDPWGNKWAGPVPVRAVYDWDPADFLAGVEEDAVLGVEAPLWTELVTSDSEIDRLVFPRLQALAEVGWTAQQQRSWEAFRERLAAQASRMEAQGIAFHPSPEIPW